MACTDFTPVRAAADEGANRAGHAAGEAEAVRGAVMEMTDA